MQNINAEISSSATANIPGKLTYDEFLRAHNGRHAEFVDGEILTKMTVTRTHDNLTGFLNAILRAYVEAHDLGRIYGDAFQMKLTFGDQIRGREPDVLFVAKSNLDRVSERFLDGPADLAVEVVSRDSVLRDRNEKFLEYQSAGVKEYWIIDPMTKKAEFYVQRADGHFVPLEVSELGIFVSWILPELWLDTNWFWQPELPHLVDVLRSWKLI
jgi:Uma2 family endonuclease